MFIKLQKISISVMMLFCIPLMAGSFESLIFDQAAKANIKKMTTFAHRKGLSVVWWNVAWGQYNSNAVIDRNLLNLMNSPASPDVITLGEFKTTVFKPRTLKILEQTYKYHSFVPYDAGLEVGIAIFSKYPLYESSTFVLDWVPVNATSAEAEIYRRHWFALDPEWVKHWKRSLTYYRIQLPDGTYNTIVPVHLASPWSTYQKKFSSWKTFRTIMTADENPLLNQQMKLTQILKREFGEKMDSQPLILLGDFNIPSKVRVPILGGKPKMYKLLQGPLRSVLDPSEDTFPTKSSLYNQPNFFKKNELQIDHVFHNDKIEKMRAEVLHLKGSDHYPLFMVTE